MRLDTPGLLAQTRRGEALASAPLSALMRGIASGEVHDAQVGAFCMAAAIRGMSDRETRDLTLAMRDSGAVLDWSFLADRGPLIDKHSTGGVGDAVSLVLAPMLAACGAFVPMLSGRGLGHTGGTLDKLECIAGYRAGVDRDTLYRVVAETGLAIVGAGSDLAPADRRLYAIRDVTATVDSLPLIVASILSKKLATGADLLVMDVKHGSGAMLPGMTEAHQLADSLQRIAAAAGLPCQALLTDMDQPLAPAVGNALELLLCLDYLQGDARPARFHDVCMALGTAALCASGLARDTETAAAMLLAARASGRAAERFAMMVRALGGPADVFDWASSEDLSAPCRQPLQAVRDGWVRRVDARALGQAAVRLGAGRCRPDECIDPRVGLSEVLPVGTAVQRGEPLLQIHAARREDVLAVESMLREAIEIGEQAPLARPLVVNADTAPHVCGEVA